MDMNHINAQGLALLGCGKMGSAMLQGWLGNGLLAQNVWILDPFPSDWLKAQGVHINEGLPAAPAAVLIAVKPQMMGEALPTLQALGNASTLFLSVAAGTTIEKFEEALGAQSPIIRAMPNTPAAVGHGMTALIGNAHATAAQMDMAEALMSAVGQVVRLENEEQMDAVIGVSGSGPAYVFHMMEVMAAAGAELGLAPELAMQLAIATVEGAGHLAMTSDESPAQLRINVTSPGGTTAAALNVLMDAQAGMPPLMRRAVAAAADRAKELAK
ncbi:MAG: pyrroline-5-carboxylate reductase [Paracoccaceae bacterium]